MAWYNKLNNPKEYLISFFKWLILGGLLGAVGGLVGTGFHCVLDLATEFRGEHSFILFLLPVGGLLIVAAYHYCGVEKTRGTNEIIDAFNEKRNVHPMLAPMIFLATGITHLFGGSAGREGAALQIGGTLGSGMARLFRLSKDDQRVLVVSGMSAVFAALFGTPLTACLFSVEFLAVGNVFGPGFLPGFVAAFVASRVALAFGVPPTSFDVNFDVTLAPVQIGQIAALAVLAALVSMLFCYVMHHTEKLFAKFFPNRYLRIFVGGVLVVLLTLVLRTYDYNGAGMDVIVRALGGQVIPAAFLLKILFTAISLGSGFKGGEIVPTFFVGATFGCLVAQFIGMDPGFGAALGMICMFCCVTNSPLTSIILSVEMFGGAYILPFAIVCVIGFVLSGNSGLYSSQTIVYSKTGTEVVNRRAG